MVIIIYLNSGYTVAQGQAADIDYDYILANFHLVKIM